MSYYLYVLKNNNGGRHYIGISANVEERLRGHNSGRVKSTKAYGPWHLAYSERHATRLEARRREVILKNNFTERNKIFSKLS